MIIISVMTTIDVTSYGLTHPGMITYGNVFEVLKSTTILYPTTTQGWGDDVMNEILHLRKEKNDIDIFKMDKPKDQEIILDTAGVRHAFSDINFFDEIKPTKDNTIGVGNGEQIDILGMGTIHFSCKAWNKKTNKQEESLFRIPNVLYIPNLTANLIVPSYHRNEGGLWSTENGDNIYLGTEKGNCWMVGHLGDTYYKLDQVKPHHKNHTRLEKRLANEVDSDLIQDMFISTRSGKEHTTKP